MNLDGKNEAVVHFNEAGDLVVVFPRKDSQIESLFELEMKVGDFVCGLSATDDEFLVFFPAGSLASDVFGAIYSLDAAIVNVVSSPEIVPWWPAIPIVDGVTIDA